MTTMAVLGAATSKQLKEGQHTLCTSSLCRSSNLPIWVPFFRRSQNATRPFMPAASRAARGSKSMSKTWLSASNLLQQPCQWQPLFCTCINQAPSADYL